MGGFRVDSSAIIGDLSNVAVIVVGAVGHVLERPLMVLVPRLAPTLSPSLTAAPSTCPTAPTTMTATLLRSPMMALLSTLKLPSSTLPPLLPLSTVDKQMLPNFIIYLNYEIKHNQSKK